MACHRGVEARHLAYADIVHLLCRAVQRAGRADAGVIAGGAVRVGGDGNRVTRSRQVLALEEVGIPLDRRNDPVGGQVAERLLECRRLVVRRECRERRVGPSRRERADLVDDDPHDVPGCGIAALHALAQVGDLDVEIRRQRAPSRQRLLARLVCANRLDGHEVPQLHMPPLHLAHVPELGATHSRRDRRFQRFAQDRVRGAQRRRLDRRRIEGPRLGEPAILARLPGGKRSQRVVGQPIVPPPADAIGGRLFGILIEKSAQVLVGQRSDAGVGRRGRRWLGGSAAGVGNNEQENNDRHSRHAGL